MASSLKIQKIQSKITNLQVEHQKLLEKRHQEIAALIAKTDLAAIDDEILMGAFLDISQKMITDKKGQEAWQKAGEKFLHISVMRQKTAPAQTAPQPPQAAVES